MLALGNAAGAGAGIGAAGSWAAENGAGGAGIGGIEGVATGGIGSLIGGKVMLSPNVKAHSYLSHSFA